MLHQKVLTRTLVQKQGVVLGLFYLFLKSGRWGVRVDQHRRFCSNVPGFLFFLENEDYCFFRNLSSVVGGGKNKIYLINDGVR